MKNKITLILILITGHFTVAISQNFSCVATCDTTYSVYIAKKAQVSRSIKKICRNFLYSKEIKRELKGAIRKEDYQKIESILYWLLHKEWCSNTEKSAKELIKLNIPSLNNWILREATSNNVDIECSKVTDVCYFQYGSFKVSEIEEQIKNEKDDVNLAHKALLISQFANQSILAQVSQLRNSKNIFARFTFAKLLYYFDQHEECRNFLIKIIEEEIQTLNDGSHYSINYVYAPWSIDLLQRISSKETLHYYETVNKLYDESIEYYNGLESKTTDQMNKESSLNRAKFVLNKIYKIKECP